MKFTGHLILVMMCMMSFALYGQSAKTYVDAGYKLEKSKDFHGAIESYDKAIALNTENKYHLEALFFRGNCYRNKSDYTKARADYDSAINLSEKLPNQNPRFLSDLHFNRALLRIQGFNYKGGIKDLDMVVKYTPKDAYSFALRAKCKYDIDDKVGACQDF